MSRLEEVREYMSSAICHDVQACLVSEDQCPDMVIFEHGSSYMFPNLSRQANEQA
jgi:hypothetical protein